MTIIWIFIFCPSVPQIGPTPWKGQEILHELSLAFTGSCFLVLACLVTETIPVLSFWSLNILIFLPFTPLFSSFHRTLRFFRLNLRILWASLNRFLVGSLLCLRLLLCKKKILVSPSLGEDKQNTLLPNPSTITIFPSSPFFPLNTLLTCTLPAKGPPDPFI